MSLSVSEACNSIVEISRGVGEAPIPLQMNTRSRALEKQHLLETGKRRVNPSGGDALKKRERCPSVAHRASLMYMPPLTVPRASSAMKHLRKSKPSKKLQEKEFLLEKRKPTKKKSSKQASKKESKKKVKDETDESESKKELISDERKAASPMGSLVSHYIRNHTDDTPRQSDLTPDAIPSPTRSPLTCPITVNIETTNEDPIVKRLNDLHKSPTPPRQSISSLSPSKQSEISRQSAAVLEENEFTGTTPRSLKKLRLWNMLNIGL